jgi:hypothetical protein
MPQADAESELETARALFDGERLGSPPRIPATSRTSRTRSRLSAERRCPSAEASPPPRSLRPLESTDHAGAAGPRSVERTPPIRRRAQPTPAIATGAGIGVRRLVGSLVLAAGLLGVGGASVVFAASPSASSSPSTLSTHQPAGGPYGGGTGGMPGGCTHSGTNGTNGSSGSSGSSAPTTSG